MTGMKIADSNDKKLIPMRCLMVWNEKEKKYIEKYRLQYRNDLIYAKGKINFDFNYIYKDNNGVKHNIINKYALKDSFPSSLYAFYNEGFFFKRSSSTREDDFYEYVYQSLSEMVKTKQLTEKQIDRLPGNWKMPYYDSDHFTFEGWWTKKEGGKQIDTIAHIKSRTTLFDKKKKDELPEITLYAHWKISKYTLVVHNITRTYTDNKHKKHIGYSSFTVVENGKKKTKKGNAKELEDRRAVFKDILYGTNITNFLSNRIKNIVYHSWCVHALDGTTQEKKLRSNPQKHIAWSKSNIEDISGDVTMKSSFYVKRNVWIEDLEEWSNTNRITIYPQFTPMVIFKRYTFPEERKISYYDFTTGQHKRVKTVGGHYYLLFDGVNMDDHLREWVPGIVNDGCAELSYYKKASEKKEYEEYLKTLYMGYPDIQYYNWLFDKLDNNLKSYRYSWDGNVPFSSTIVFKIAKTDKASDR